jgi:hypothetical protein
MMDELPTLALADEEIRGDEGRASNELPANDNGGLAGEGYGGASHDDTWLARVVEDAVPALEDGLTALEDVPTGMDARDLVGSRPEAIHERRVLLIEGAIKGIVRGQDVVNVAHAAHPTRDRRAAKGNS